MLGTIVYVGMSVMPEKIAVCQKGYIGQDKRKRI
jgi:hypothetical protein